MAEVVFIAVVALGLVGVFGLYVFVSDHIIPNHRKIDRAVVRLFDRLFTGAGRAGQRYADWINSVHFGYPPRECPNRDQLMDFDRCDECGAIPQLEPSFLHINGNHHTTWVHPNFSSARN